jgi:ribosomal protein S18 acetylase RimI-like enzyme
MIPQTFFIPPAALDALVGALENDPFYAALTPDADIADARRRAILREYFAYALHEGNAYGVVTIEAETNAGAAIWLLPQADGVAQKLQATKNAALKNILSPRGFENYVAMIEAMSPHAERVVPRRAWYLSILGIAPARQGKGLGKRLLAPTLADADARGASCFLETFNPRTLPFYESVGFRAVAQHAEQVTGQAYWIMVRAPLITAETAAHPLAAA